MPRLNAEVPRKLFFLIGTVALWSAFSGQAWADRAGQNGAQKAAETYHRTSGIQDLAKIREAIAAHPKGWICTVYGLEDNGIIRNFVDDGQSFKMYFKPSLFAPEQGKRENEVSLNVFRSDRTATIESDGSINASGSLKEVTELGRLHKYRLSSKLTADGKVQIKIIMIAVFNKDTGYGTCEPEISPPAPSSVSSQPAAPSSTSQEWDNPILNPSVRQPEQGVDLRWLFRSELSQCQVGGTCHAFASVAAFEAACYSATRKRVDLSEVPIWTRNLKENLLNRNQLTIFPLEGGRIWGMDSGYVDRDLRWLVDEKLVCSERECPVDEKTVVGPMREIVKRLGMLEIAELNDAYRRWKANEISEAESSKRQKETREKYGKAAVEELERLMTTRWLPGSQVTPNWKLETRDPDIQGCFENYRYEVRREGTSVARIKELLDHQIPVVCSLKLRTSPESKEFAHSMVIIGYRPNPQYPNGVQYLVRDSNGSSPSWDWKIPGCGLGISYIIPRPKLIPAPRGDGESQPSSMTAP
jgi:hypothetical protein